LLPINDLAIKEKINTNNKRIEELKQEIDKLKHQNDFITKDSNQNLYVIEASNNTKTSNFRGQSPEISLNSIEIDSLSNIFIAVLEKKIKNEITTNSDLLVENNRNLAILMGMKLKTDSTQKEQIKQLPKSLQNLFLAVYLLKNKEVKMAKDALLKEYNIKNPFYLESVIGLHFAYSLLGNKEFSEDLWLKNKKQIQIEYPEIKPN
jgi:hypothetical protein